MNVNILGFGIARDIFGTQQVSLDVAEGATVADVKAALERQYPRLGLLATYMVAVNNEYAQGLLQLNAADEIAIIPPVSGG